MDRDPHSLSGGYKRRLALANQLVSLVININKDTDKHMMAHHQYAFIRFQSYVVGYSFGTKSLILVNWPECSGTNPRFIDIG